MVSSARAVRVFGPKIRVPRGAFLVDDHRVIIETQVGTISTPWRGGVRTTGVDHFAFFAIQGSFLICAFTTSPISP